MKRRLLVVILLIAMLTESLALGAFAETFPSGGDGIQFLYSNQVSNSDKEAYDGEWYYYVDTLSNNAVYRERYDKVANGTEVLNIDKSYLTNYSVDQILIYDEILLVSTGRAILSISISDRNTKTVYTSEKPIKRFAETNGYILVLSDGNINIVSPNGKSELLIQSGDITSFWLEEGYICYMRDSETITKIDVRTNESAVYENKASSIGDAPLSLRAKRGYNISTLRSKFPAGKYWNHMPNKGTGKAYNNQDGWTNTPCPTHNGYCGTSKQTCNGFAPDGSTELSWQCMGYAEKCGYDVSGYNPRNSANGWSTNYNSSALDSLKAGDIVRYRGDRHSIYIIGVSGDTVTYTDCNSDGHCIIRWDATISKSTLKSSFSYVRSAPGSAIPSHTCNKGSYEFYEAAHPHYKCYRCSICSTIWCNHDEPTVVDSCLECHRPDTPVLLGMQESYEPNRNIVFKWNATANTTHYNVFLDKKNSEGGYERIENVFYAESGFARKFEEGQYRVLLQSTNSNYFEADGSNWLFAEGRWVEFAVCGEHDCDKGEYVSFEGTHPHYKFYRCSICYKTWCNYDETTFVDSCLECHRPDTPVLLDMQKSYDPSTNVTFKWNATSNTTHYNIFFDKKNSDGEYARIDHTFYVESGYSKKFDEGQYRVLLQSTNSDYYEADGSNWLFAEGSWVEFEVAHSYTYKATTAPTTSADGKLTGTCSRCNGTTSVTLPKLNTTDYSYSVVKAASCSATGTGRYTWKNTDYGTFRFDVTIAKTSHSYTATVTAPTCTAQGYTTHTCSSCGDSYKDSYTNALGHSYIYKATTAPTTSGNGKLTGTCSRCNGTTSVTLPKLNTTDYSYSVVKAASCTATGTGRYTWKNTDYGTFRFDVTIAKTNHSYTATVTAPTCTAQGYTTHTCSSCGDSYKDSYTNALGHSYTYKATTAPTASADGKLTGTCSRCNGTTSVTLPKLNTTDYSYSVVKAASCTATGTGRYTWKNTDYGTFRFDVTIAKTSHSYTATVTAPTCTAQGYTTHTCSSCGDSYKDSYTNALGHSYTYKATTVPTTSADGKLTGTCSRCNGTTSVTLPKLNTTDYSYSVVKAASCTATGTGRYTWKNTDYGTFRFDVTIAKTSHSYTATVTAPTCTAQGYTTHTCSYCGDSYKDSYTNALGHSYIYKATTAPTTSTDGKLTGTCSRCNGTTSVTLPKLNTTDYSYSVVKAASCTATGTGRYTWKNTDYGTFQFDVTIAKTSHSYTATVTAPTCTAQGYTTHTCSSCGDSYKDSYTNALGHSYTYKATTAPTTSADGKLTGTCSRCNGTTSVTLPKLNTTDYSYSVVKAASCTATGTGRYTWKNTEYGTFRFDVTIAKTSHSYTATVTAPTCTAQGYTTHTCSSCGDSYKDSYTNALGHSYTYKATTAPTTSTDGKLTGTCGRCNGTTSVTLPKLNTTDYSYSVVKAASCTATGTGRYTWKNTDYGTFRFDVTIAKTSHSYTATVTAPTCTEMGYTTNACVFCGETYVSDYVAPQGHDFVNHSAKNATCTESGWYAYRTCSRCDYSSYAEIPALGHDLIDHAAKAATDTESGWEAYQTCSRCDYTTYKEIPPKSHIWSAPIRENEIAPSCTEKGSYDEVVYCADCRAELSRKTNEIPALGHDWGAAVYEWTGDYSAITARRVCKRDGNHAEAEAGVIVKTVREATYDSEGEIVYTATFRNAAFAGQSKTVKTPRLTRPSTAGNPFTDVKAGAYYYDAVLWAAANNVTAGTSATAFSPEVGCTRAQVVTFLWRAAGQPKPTTGSNPFGDVKNGTYYYEAVLWAVEKGITAGTSTTTFSPDDTCTRAQIVTFLWRYEGQPAPTTANNPFADVKESAYFAKAVLWAAESGVTSGTSATTFSPKDTCTRAQVVTFLYRDITNK